MNTGFVSPCCGADYQEAMTSECCGAPFAGETDLCSECLEHTGANEGYYCDDCDEWFDTPEDASEYNELRKEKAMEDKAEAKRKYNE